MNLVLVTALQFYKNYGTVYVKKDESANTVMNVTRMTVAAGDLYTYFEVYAKKQPFVGGRAAGDSGDYEQRFNLNIGYYF